MPSPDDRRAVRILLLLTLAGLGVRLVTGRTTTPGGVGYRAAAEARPAAESVAARAARLARPLRRGERIDVDVAPVGELARLPRIGPGLANRIADDRDRNGPYGSLPALGRVPGIGPKTLEQLAPFVRFSGRPRAPAPPAGDRVAVNRATAEELAALPGIGPALGAAIVAHRTRHGPFRRPEDLLAVRGIGPATLERLKARIILP